MFRQQSGGRAGCENGNEASRPVIDIDSLSLMAEGRPLMQPDSTQTPGILPGADYQFRHSYTTEQTFKTISRPLPNIDGGKERDIAAVH